MKALISNSTDLNPRLFSYIQVKILFLLFKIWIFSQVSTLKTGQLQNGLQNTHFTGGKEEIGGKNSYWRIFTYY